MTQPRFPAAHDRLIDRLSRGEFEFELSIAQAVYYWVERKVGHALLRRHPPPSGEPRLLNLGCGPHIFPGWTNADDYAMKRRFREKAFRPEWHLDITREWRCRSEYWDGIFCEHVIEHVRYSEAIHVMRECLRTLKPGAWLRISVPDLALYVAVYGGGPARPGHLTFPAPAVGVSFLTQMHLHRSAWDGELMVRVLSEIGFVDARVVAFGSGMDARLLRDDPDKAHESLYVEARRPA